jgi:hypothetical protein
MLMLVKVRGFYPVTFSPCCATVSLQIGLVGSDCFLVPFEANARDIRNAKQSLTDFIGFLEDRIGPVLPFQPVRSLRDPHHVSGYLRVKMSGHRYARRTRNGRCP